MVTPTLKTPLLEAHHAPIDRLSEKRSHWPQLPEAFALAYRSPMGGASAMHELVGDFISPLRKAETSEKLRDEAKFVIGYINGNLQLWLNEQVKGSKDKEALINQASATLRSFVVVQVFARAGMAGVKPEAFNDAFDPKDYANAVRQYMTQKIDGKTMAEQVRMLSASVRTAQKLHGNHQWESIRLPADAMDYFKNVVVEPDKGTGFHDGHITRAHDFTEPTKVRRARLSGYLEIASHAKTLGELAGIIRYAELEHAQNAAADLGEYEHQKLRTAFNTLCVKGMGIAAPEGAAAMTEAKAETTFTALLHRTPGTKLDEIIHVERNRRHKLAHDDREY